MTNISDKKFFQECLREIEKKQGWGDFLQWTTSDFENLSNQILEVTNTRLSIATLKRILGKVNYSSKPSTSTLNCLAQYIGYENWRTYVQFHELNNSKQATTNRKVKRPLNKKTLSILLTLLLFGLTLAYVININLTVKEREYAFHSKTTVSEGVPNSVIFSYDASQAGPEETVMIQQSWDKRRRETVSYNENIHTSTYYYPGHFEAKLLVNDKIVKRQSLLIKTDGWLSLVEQKDKPIYYEKSQFIGDGKMSISENHLLQKNISVVPKAPWVSFYNVGNIDSLYTEDFEFHTQIKNGFETGINTCQFVQIVLLYEGGIFRIPLSNKGCVGSLNFRSGIDKKVDPTALGVNWDKWIDIRLKYKDQVGALYINNELAYPVSFGLSKKRIVGIRFRFQGIGSVRFVEFSKTNGEVVFSDNFQSR